MYVSEKKDYLPYILKVIKKSKLKFCYVTFNKSYASLKENFKKKGINTNGFYFVDCISWNLEEPKPVEDCDFIEEPYNLKAISNSIKKAIKKDCNLVIFDSLSDILVYNQYFPAGGEILLRFIQSFSSELKKKKGKSIFICKLKDKENFLIEETLKIFDKTIRS